VNPPAPGGLQRPRVVIVTRKSSLELMLERHGTVGQARFYLRTRGEDIRAHEEAHDRFQAAVAAVQSAIPSDQRRTRVDRDDLDRFLFADDDLILVVGQDGLVPNAAKYLRGQLVAGINPDPERYDGVLCMNRPENSSRVLEWMERRAGEGFTLERRTMAVAEREDGQRLLSLNEVFIGHRSHQSARYRISSGGESERHSSSGLICSTGTGSTGWARSIAEQRGLESLLPSPTDPKLAWFVREPFPSVNTGTSLDHGFVEDDEPLEIVSEMSEGGVLFADGIESDRVEFVTGQRVRISIAESRLNLVRSGSQQRIPTTHKTTRTAPTLSATLTRRAGRPRR
jgi:NAD kinase